MEADLEGAQRKVVTARVAPLRAAHGDAGIPLRDGRSLPFAVSRLWSAPAGHYEERWYLVHPETREVLFESAPKNVLIWGLQSLTEVTDEVRESIQLAAGTYLLVFALGGLRGGEFTAEAAEVAEAAA